MGGKRYSKEEIKQIKNLMDERLTSREVARRLGRTESAIRNLRYREKLVRRVKDDVKAFFKQRNELRDSIEILKEQRQKLINEVESLKNEKEKLEMFISIDKFLLQQILTQVLANLKMRRPDLFTLSEQEQLVMLAKLFLKNILH